MKIVNQMFKMIKMMTTQAGNEFGAATPYGSALIRVGQTEQK